MGWLDFLWRKPKREAVEGPVYTAADFPIPDHVLNSAPVPSDASVVTLTFRDTTPLFAVSCCEPNTRGPGLTENERLDLALAATPGASAAKSEPSLHLEPPGGVGDEFFFHPYYLEVTEANVLALRAAGLAWSPEARHIAGKYPVRDDAVRKVKGVMLAVYTERLRGLFGGAENAGATTESPVNQFGSQLIEQARRDLGLPAEPLNGL